MSDMLHSSHGTLIRKDKDHCSLLPDHNDIVSIVFGKRVFLTVEFFDVEALKKLRTVIDEAIRRLEARKISNKALSARESNPMTDRRDQQAKVFLPHQP